MVVAMVTGSVPLAWHEARWPPNSQMEPTRQTVARDQNAAARGSFAALGRHELRNGQRSRRRRERFLSDRASQTHRTRLTSG